MLSFYHMRTHSLFTTHSYDTHVHLQYMFFFAQNTKSFCTLIYIPSFPTYTYMYMYVHSSIFNTHHFNITHTCTCTCTCTQLVNVHKGIKLVQFDLIIDSFHAKTFRYTHHLSFSELNANWLNYLLTVQCRAAANSSKLVQVN